MTSSVGPGPGGPIEEECERLRRRVVADGYSSAHSCQHCNKLTIINWSTLQLEHARFWPEWWCKLVHGTSDETPVVASMTEVKQRAAAGCRLWSLVSDRVEHEILKHKRDRIAGMPNSRHGITSVRQSSHSPVSRLNTHQVETSGSVALSNNEVQNLRGRCLSKCNTSPHTRNTSAEACGYYVELLCGSGPVWPAAHLPMRIRAYGNGLEHDVEAAFTVLELPRGLQISNNRCGFAWPVNIDPGSAQSFRLMRTWIQKCELEHGSGISDHYPSTMPTMLLKIDGVDQCGSIRLVEPIPGEKHQYLALSYCWGPNSQKKTLTTTTQAEFIRDGIRVEELDATIQDAIKVTKELGYLYLWIDALCIIQDDADFKASELGRMDDIYENASITIVAARASSVSEGFLTPRKPAGASAPDKVFKMACKRSHEQLNVADDWVVLVPKEEGHWGTPKEPWECRAWTVQEDLLSRRQLRFGAEQTSWVCYCSQKPYKDFDGWFGSDLREAREKRVYLILDKPMEILVRILQQPDLVESVKEARRAWYALIEIYSQRTLSFQDDRLPAISAIARRMASILGDEYYCGIWKSKAPWELQWWSKRYATSVQDASNHETGQPSWTWASQRSGVEIRVSDGNMSRVDVNFEVVEHVAEYKSPEDIYGAVRAAQLRVRGLVTTAPFRLQECHTSWITAMEPCQHEQGETRRSEMGPDRASKLREIFLESGRVCLDRSPHDLLADSSRDIENKQIVLLLVGYDFSAPELSIQEAMGLVLLNEGGNYFSRLGTFIISTGSIDDIDCCGDYSDIPTKDEFISTLRECWGGQDSVQEIILV